MFKGVCLDPAAIQFHALAVLASWFEIFAGEVCRVRTLWLLCPKTQIAQIVHMHTVLQAFCSEGEQCVRGNSLASNVFVFLFFFCLQIARRCLRTGLAPHDMQLYRIFHPVVVDVFSVRCAW